MTTSATQQTDATRFQQKDGQRLPEGQKHLITIKPPRGLVTFGLRELFQHRELLYFLALRDIKVRYKQTIFGAAWAVLQPLATMVVFSLFFGRLAQMPSDGLPYPLFSLAALVPWTFFANGLGAASGSMVASSNLLTKVYFPRLTIPIAAIFGSAVDFLLAFGVLLLMTAYYDVALTLRMLWLPLFFALAFATTLGLGLWFSALNVQFRDIRHVIPFLTQLLMFATPVVYPSSLISEPWRTAYGLNPMAGVVEGFRWALLGTDTAPGAIIGASTAAAILLVITGALYFRNMEKVFADIV